MTPSRSALVQRYVHEQKSLAVIAQEFEISPNTVMRRMIDYGIPRRPPHPTMKVKKTHGRWYKLCTGPLHKGEWIPFSNFLRQPNGKPRSYCRACETSYKGAEPLVNFTPSLYGWLRSCVNTLGVMETSRRLGISQPTLLALRDSRRKQRLRIRQKTARAIIALRKELNETGEVRHRKSILYGAKERGRVERVPTARNHFYRKDGDSNAELRKRNRAGKVV